ncbi:MAG TPA: hypothetical protein DEP46_11990 [Blastocatellia bacterium]|nr:hypothetical protein [Blastocatellia bacterium]
MFKRVMQASAIGSAAHKADLKRLSPIIRSIFEAKNSCSSDGTYPLVSRRFNRSGHFPRITHLFNIKGGNQ